MEHHSLFELNKIIGDILAKNLEPSYWIVAEIGEIRHNQKGHCYLELVEKEDNQIKAKSRATIWSYTYRNLSAWFEGITGQNLRQGMKILFNATIQYHEVYGLSLNIRDIDAQYTLGERAKNRQEVIDRLMEDGVFEMNKELDLPTVPQRIAVISSETAAGYGDFVEQLNRNENNYSFDVQLFHSTMQGDQAESSIITSMLQVFEQIEDFDLLTIIRGGGASLDLDCFDSYDLGSYIAQFPIPVITGIGHERDETIADLVAHTKLKTPTAVSEFILSGMSTFEVQLDQYFDQVAGQLNHSLDEENYHLDQLTNKFQRNVQILLNDQDLKLKALSQNLKFSQQSLKKIHENTLSDAIRFLTKQPLQVIVNLNETLGHLEKELEILDPTNVLKRGYSITMVNGVNVNKIKIIDKESTLTTLTKQTEILSKLLSQKDRTKN